MKILKDGFRADMERIKRELTVLQGVSIHVGILGDAGSDILMIAGVHEYGATISAKNVKHHCYADGYFVQPAVCPQPCAQA